MKPKYWTITFWIIYQMMTQQLNTHWLDILIPSMCHFIRPKEKHFPSWFATQIQSSSCLDFTMRTCLFLFIIIVFLPKALLYF